MLAQAEEINVQNATHLLTDGASDHARWYGRAGLHYCNVVQPEVAKAGYHRCATLKRQCYEGMSVRGGLFGLQLYQLRLVESGGSEKPG